MRKNKAIIEELASLPDEDLANFTDFIKSPFFKVNHSTVDLLVLLNKYGATDERIYSPDFLAKRLKKSSGTILNHLTQLGQAYKDFKVHLAVREQQVLRNRIYFDDLDNRNDYDKLMDDLPELKKWFENHQVELSYQERQEQYHRILYLEERISAGLLNQGENDKLKEALEIKLDLFLLHYFYWLAELEHRNAQPELDKLTDSFILYSERYTPEIEFKLSRVYILAYLLNRDKTESSFLRLKTYFEGFIDEIDLADRDKLMYSLYNFCFSLINKGDDRGEKWIYEMFRFADKHDFLKINLIPSLFKGAVKAGLSQSDFEWTAYFMTTYKQYLEEIHWESTMAYCNALVDFQKENYSEVYHLLSITPAAYTQEKVQFAILRFKACFSLEEIEGIYKESKLLLNLCKQLKSSQADAVKKFRSVALAILNNKYDSKEKLLARIEQEAMVEKKWLKQLLKK